MKTWISILSILLVLSVLLTACAQVPVTSVDPTDPPTEKPTEAATTEPTTERVYTLTDLDFSEMHYSGGTPEGYYPFICADDKKERMLELLLEKDTEEVAQLLKDFTPGYIYLLDTNKQEFYCIIDEPILAKHDTSDYLFCITADNTLIVTDMTGTMRVELYRAKEPLGVKSLAYWRTSLYFIEGSSIMNMDLITGEVKKLFEYEGAIDADPLYGIDEEFPHLMLIMTETEDVACNLETGETAIIPETGKWGTAAFELYMEYGTWPEEAVDPTYIAYYYSFTSDEIAAARDAALAYTQTIDPDSDDIMDYQVFSMAYDPELTSLLLFKKYEWDDRLYRDQYMAFSFFYRGRWEEEGGLQRRYEDTGYILCHRENADASWTVAEYSETGGDPTALPAEYLPAFGTETDVVAGYTQGIDGLKVIARYELSEGNFRPLAYVLDKEQLLPAGTALTESELREFEKLFSIRETEDPWFNFTLTSEFRNPADVDIYALMYSGPSEVLTQEDRDFAEQKGLTPELLNKYSAEMIDVQLQRLFGITLEETNGIGLDQFVYDQETDCYYDSHGDSKVSYQSIIGGIRMPNGDIAVYYERQQMIGLNPAQAQMVVVLRPVGDSYQILMNVRAGLGYEVVNRTEPLPAGYTLDDLVTPITRDLDWSPSMVQSGVVSFSIPKIYPFSDDAVRVQQQIQENYLRQYHDTFIYHKINNNTDMTLSPHYCEIRYETALNGEILSIVIYTDMFVDFQGYQVYNFHLGNGNLLNNAELLETLEIDTADYEELLGGLISKAFTDKFGESRDPDDSHYDLYMKQKALNDSPENLAAAKLYLDAEGNLWAICNVYSLAGAGVYPEVFSLSELMP